MNKIKDKKPDWIRLYKNKIIYSVIAIVCFGLLCGVTHFYMEKRGAIPKREVNMVVLGDSIMGLPRDESAVPHQLAKGLGITVFNGALGGTCLGRQDMEMRLGFTKDSLSMVGLSKSIGAQDFGVQQTVRIREGATEYFPETIDEMENIDFEKVDVLIIEHGLNDYHAGIPIYAEENLYDEYTFTGALRSSIRELQEAYPKLRIVLITPTYTWYTLLDLTCEEYNTGSGILEEYVEAEMEVAREMGVEIIDVYHDFYPHEAWEDWQLYTDDGLHPNDAGRVLLTQTIAEYFQDHP